MLYKGCRFIGTAILALVLPLFIAIPLLADMEWEGTKLSSCPVSIHWAAYLIEFILVFLILKWWYSRFGRRNNWNISVRWILLSILFGVIAYAVSTGLLLISSKYPTLFHQGDTVTGSSNIPLLNGRLKWLTLIAASIGSPILEEIAFRGIVLTQFGELLNNRILAAVMASLLFAIAHMTGVAASAGIFFMGMVNVALDERCESLTPGIIVHITYNTIISASAVMTIGGLLK